MEGIEVTIETHATALAAAIEAALPGWVERSVHLRLERAGMAPTPEISAAAAAAGERARAEVGEAVRSLLEADIDDQRTTPLSLLRGAVRYPTDVLRQAGVPPVARDSVQERLLPEDVYDLSPASFADVDEALFEPGLSWGAAKAFVHKQRHGGKRPHEEPAVKKKKKVVAYVPDLMDRSKVASGPAQVTFVNRPADLAEAAATASADLVVVDLTRPGVVDALAGVEVPVLGFANHTNREAMDAALAAGAEQVMARSAFFSRLDDLLGE